MRRLVVGVALILVGCGYDGSYRYPCQDPNNWDSPDCHRPACLVDGACPDTLLGFDPFATATTEAPVPAEQPVDEGANP